VGWPLEPRFYIPDDVLSHFRLVSSNGEKDEKAWNDLYSSYQRQYPLEAAELSRRLAGKLPHGWETALPIYPADPKGIATRAASGQAINALAARLPELVGGSADLRPSNNTWIEGSPAFQANNHSGRNFHFGVREHAMGAITNGLALHHGLIPYCATFLVFTDYMRTPIRLSALSHIQSIWVMTHDSIGVGEDGPTHQPVEQITSLRAIPNLVVIRPADANETSEAWKVAISRRDGPTLLALTRQALPILDRSKYSNANGLSRGAYILKDPEQGKPQVILMASGSEVTLIVEAGQILTEAGLRVRLVSFPSWELFKQQDLAYQQDVLPTHIRCRVAIEAGVSLGWERWVGDLGKIIAVDRFGASAPYQVIYEQFGLTVTNIVTTAQQILNK
jgi:transketolase